MSFTLTSPAFKNNDPIPVKYTCQGANISHALEWSDPPPGTKSFVLINDDPDDDGPQPWVHWLVYNIPGACRGLPEGMPAKEVLEDGTLQGTNSFRKLGYGGPCPPTGVHHYTFTLYALKVDKLEIDPNAASGAFVGYNLNGNALAKATVVYSTP